jgi:hypothetical protein
LLILKLDHLDLSLFLSCLAFYFEAFLFSSHFELLAFFFSLAFTFLELFPLHLQELFLSLLHLLYFLLFFKSLDL